MNPLLLLGLALLSSCATTEVLTSEAEHLTILTEDIPKECKKITTVAGRGTSAMDWSPSVGAKNRMLNQAAGVGADAIHIIKLDKKEATGIAYRCKTTKAER